MSYIYICLCHILGISGHILGIIIANFGKTSHGIPSWGPRAWCPKPRHNMGSISIPKRTHAHNSNGNKNRKNSNNNNNNINNNNNNNNIYILIINMKNMYRIYCIYALFNLMCVILINKKRCKQCHPFAKVVHFCVAQSLSLNWSRAHCRL